MRKTRIFTALLILIGGGIIAQAGSYVVTPVRIELSAQQPRAIIAVRNMGDEPAKIQVRAYRWAIQGDEQKLSITDEILLNPPIFAMATGETQYVRLGLRQVKPDLLETSYRLIFEELPPPPKPGFKGVATLLRLSVPVFAKPAGKPLLNLVWRLAPLEAGTLKLTVENHGNIHVQFKKLTFTAEGHSEPDHFEESLMYLLPGGGHEWILQQERLVRAAAVLLVAQTDNGEIRVNLRKSDQ